MPFLSRIGSAAARAYGFLGGLLNIDPFFNYVTALLHGDGTNAAANNTFLDSSTNNYTITRTGNVTQGTFTPFSQTGWSGYFSGTTDCLTFTNQATTGDFTCECWFFPTGDASGGYSNLFGGAGTTGPTNTQLFTNTATGGVGIAIGGSAVISVTGAGSVAKNQWNHIAFVRSGTTVAIFVNGNRIATGTSSAALNVDRISSNTFTGYLPIGYISNARITTTAVYNVSSTTYTVPTSPLTAIAGTYILTLQSNRWVDNSASPLTITLSGTPTIQAFSPFNPTSAYSAGSIGGSAYFDGGANYLGIPTATGLQLSSTDAFTIEFWWYPTAITAQQYVQSAWSVGSTGYAIGTGVSIYGGTELAFFDGTTWRKIGNVNSYRWHHVAITSSGTASSAYMYMNGSPSASFTVASTINYTSGTWYLGWAGTGTAYLNGYVTGFRIVKGTNLYPNGTPFTVPTTPPTAIANTQLLLSSTNGAIIDNASVGDYQTFGNAQISTSVVKYGSGSINLYTNNNSDYLKVKPGPTGDLGTGDFTVESWIYPQTTNTAYATGSFACIIDADSPTDTGTGWWVLHQANNAIYFGTNNGSNAITSSNAISSANTWYHVAVNRTAGNVTTYVNGTAVGSMTYSAGIGAQNRALTVGVQVGSTRYWKGYIDDLRITKGIGRYPYNFTPPTVALPDIGGTVTPTADPYFRYTTLLLPGNGTNLAQNNTFLDGSTNNFTITRNGNTTQGTYTPFSQTGWGYYFGGSSDYINFASSASLALASDFTVEAWVYNNNTTGTFNQAILYDSSTNAISAFEINNGTTFPSIAGITATNTVTRYTFTGPNVPVLQWVHVAWVRSAGVVKVYVNGTASTSTLSNSATTGQIIQVGNGRTSGAPWNGYISNLRIVSSALYTNNFTPSSVPLTAISGTQLLTCQNNRFIDASSNALTATAVGSPSVQAFSPFAPTGVYGASTNGGAGYFDGVGDYLTVPTGYLTNIGTGNFTVEGWWNFSDFTTRTTYFQRLWSFGTGLANDVTLNVDNSGNLAFRINDTVIASQSSGAMALNTWNHVALVRSSGTVTIYLNGVSVGSAANSSNISTQATSPFYVGSEAGGAGGYFIGYQSNLRITNTAVYTTAFTPPAAPLTAIANTQLLLSYTNAGIIDNTGKNELETQGNAQISTVSSKFGGSSIRFPGTAGDALTIPYSQNFNFGTGDFTVECWANITYVQYSAIITSTAVTVTASSWLLGYSNTANQMAFGIDSSGVATIGADYTAYAGTWTHIAVSRYGSTMRMFFNGIQVASVTNTTNYTGVSTSPVKLGARYVDSTLYPLNGYIDDLRVTKGIARYTSNFTPPTTAFLTQ